MRYFDMHKKYILQLSKIFLGILLSIFFCCGIKSEVYAANTPFSLYLSTDCLFPNVTGETKPNVSFDLYETGSDFDYRSGSLVETVSCTSNIQTSETINTNFSRVDISDSNRHYFVIKATSPDSKWVFSDEYLYMELDMVYTTEANGDIKYRIRTFTYSYEVDASGTMQNSNNGILGGSPLSYTYAANFTLQYNPEPSPASFSFTAKQLFSNSWPTGYSGKIKLEPLDTSDVSGAGHWVSELAPMPGGTTSAIEVTVDENNAEANFGSVEYPYTAPTGHGEQPSGEAGALNSRCYMYKISLDIPAGAVSDGTANYYNGVKYDSTVQYIKIWVIQYDDGNGNRSTGINVLAGSDLDTCGGTFSQAEFTNSYVAKGSIAESAKVSLTNKTLAAGDFSFSLKDSTGSVMETVLNDASGNGSFTALQYSESDIGKTYTYSLSLEAGTNPAITYDNTEYRITHTITAAGTYTNGLEDLSISEKIEKYERGAWVIYAGTPSFTNVYSASGTATISVKNNTGAGSGATALATKSFSFKITETDASHNPLVAGVSETIAVTGAGTGQFSPIAISAAGSYYFTIEEVLPASVTVANPVKDGISYDTSTHYLVLVATDDGQGNYIVSSQTLDGVAVTNGSAIDFTNTYSPTSTSTSLDGSVSVTGRSLAAGDYSFRITGSQGAPLPAVTTVTNTAGGAFDFGAISFTDVGTYTYIVRQDTGSVPGVTTDTSVFTVKITVKDDGLGNLVIDSKEISKGLTAQPSISFTNVYSAEGSANISLRVVLHSDFKPLKAGEFTFLLKDSSGLVINTKTNDASGIVEFAPIVYTTADAGNTYTYKVIQDTTSPPCRIYIRHCNSYSKCCCYR